MEEGTRSNYGYVFLDTIENTPYEERPKVLLMENVKALLSQTFSEDWKEINLRLERLGYKNYADSLIATDFGIPQTRDRVFIVSIKGEYSYTFPKPFKLKKRLKDYLEDVVDEKYYLSDKQIKNILGNAINKDLKDMIDRKNAVFNKKIAYTITTKQDRRIGDSNFILGDGSKEIKVKKYLKAVTNNKTEKFIKNTKETKLGYSKAYNGEGIYLDRPYQKRCVGQSKKIPTLK